jgi:hypothetical protein
MMKRQLPSVFAFLLSLSLGSISHVGLHPPWAPMSLCKISRDPAFYHGKILRVRASAEAISSDPVSPHSLTIYEQQCGPEWLASAIIMLDGESELSIPVDKFINDPKREIRVAEVVITGRFDEWATTGCFAPRFGFHDAKVEFISSVTSKPLPVMNRPESDDGQ